VAKAEELLAIDANFLARGCRVWHGGLRRWMNIKVLTLDYQADMPENADLLQKTSRIKSAANPIYDRIMEDTRRIEVWQKLKAVDGDLDQMGKKDTVEDQIQVLQCAKDVWKNKTPANSLATKAAVVQIKALLKKNGWNGNKYLAVIGHAEKEMQGAQYAPQNRQQELLVIVEQKKNELGNLCGNSNDNNMDGECVCVFSVLIYVPLNLSMCCCTIFVLCDGTKGTLETVIVYDKRIGIPMADVVVKMLPKNHATVL